MANVFDYIFWRGDLTFEQDEFNEIDSMILANLSYLPFEYAMNEAGIDPVSLKFVADTLFEFTNLQDYLVYPDTVTLLKHTVDSNRYKNIQLLGYVNKFDTDTQTQFAAITYQISNDTYFIAYRGTDSTLIGWKEDFNMGFVFPIPSQQYALDYLNYTCSQLDGKFYVGGHSKGGNLAVFAASLCDNSISTRIIKVYNFDGPGFTNRLLKTEEYQSMLDRIITLVPQSSIVGMILGHEEPYTIVQSTESNGIFQHDMFSWLIDRNNFVHLDSVDRTSLFYNTTISAWLKGTSKKQREIFIDTIFTLLCETEATTINELTTNWLTNAKIFIKSLKSLDEPTRKAINEMISLLVKLAMKNRTYLKKVH